MQWGEVSFRFCRWAWWPSAPGRASAPTKARRRERVKSRQTSGRVAPRNRKLRVKERRYRARSPATMLPLANRTPRPNLTEEQQSLTKTANQYWVELFIWNDSGKKVANQNWKSKLLPAICAFKFAPSCHAFDLHTFFRLTRALCRPLVVEGSMIRTLLVFLSKCSTRVPLAAPGITRSPNKRICRGTLSQKTRNWAFSTTFRWRIFLKPTGID